MERGGPPLGGWSGWPCVTSPSLPLPNVGSSTLRNLFVRTNESDQQNLSVSLAVSSFSISKVGFLLKRKCFETCFQVALESCRAELEEQTGLVLEVKFLFWWNFFFHHYFSLVNVFHAIFLARQAKPLRDWRRVKGRRKKRRWANQPSNQSTSQPTNHPTNQSTNQPIKQPSNQPTFHAFGFMFPKDSHSFTYFLLQKTYFVTKDKVTHLKSAKQ